MTQAADFRGVFPVFQTPFGDDGELDLAALRGELDWIATQGVQGIVLGMVSEVLRLSEREREEVSRVACSAASDHGFLAIISVGAESTSVAVRYARAAEEAGASGVMAIPPMATALPEDAVNEYYRNILAATTLPVIVQDASGYVGRALSIELQAALLASYGDRVLFKPEAIPIGPRLSALREATSGRARVFEGAGGIALIDSYRRGIVGTMPGADLCWAVVALWRSLEQGDFTSSYEIAAPLVGLIGLQPSLDAFVVVEKYLLHKQHVLTSSTARGPLSFHLDRETREEIDRLFAQLQRSVDAFRTRSGAECTRLVAGDARADHVERAE